MRNPTSPSRAYLIVTLLLLLCAARTSAEIRWTTLTSDLEMAQASVTNNLFFSSEVLLFRSALKDLNLGVIKAKDYGTTRQNIKFLTNASKAVLAINANFFDQKGDPLGLVISRGRTSNRTQLGGKTLTGIVSVSRLGVVISHRADRLPTSTVEAIQAGPRLLLNGIKVQDLKDRDRSRRSALCVDSQQRLIILISSGVFGITFQELQDFLIAEELNCQDAINLDGGGSSQLFLNLKNIDENNTEDEIYVLGRDPIPVALGLFKKNK